MHLRNTLMSGYLVQCNSNAPSQLCYCISWTIPHVSDRAKLVVEDAWQNATDATSHESRILATLNKRPFVGPAISSCA